MLEVDMGADRLGDMNSRDGGIAGSGVPACILLPSSPSGVGVVVSPHPTISWGTVPSNNNKRKKDSFNLDLSLFEGGLQYPVPHHSYQTTNTEMETSW